ncbi:MAG TPA: hypothetical protein VMG30_09685 [Acidobacteriota bacterium]|nr:hypothetical protein [Acidobacteriota bacterium]
MRSTALRFLTILALGCLLMSLFTASSVARDRWGGGGRVILVPRYSYYYPYWGWGWGGPFWNYGPYYYESVGWVKIKDHNRSDEVLVNGAFAGTVDKLKTLKLAPGKYAIQIRRDGKDLLSRDIYVVVGKTLQINADGG